MRVRIESALAARWNERQAEGEKPLPDTWEGDIPEMGLESIFRFFNRVEQHDTERLVALDYDLPSLSVGDTVTFNGASYRVDACGFSEVTA